MKVKKLFGNWANAIKLFPISHILLLTLTIILILENEGFIYLDSPNLVPSIILTFIVSCYGPLLLIHSNIKNKNIVNRILQIGSIILGGLYYTLINNINFDNITYSEALFYIRIIPLTLLGIPLIIAFIHSKQEPKIRFSRTSLFLSIIFGGIAGSIVRGGISGALASIEALFDVNINSDLYTDIGFISEIFLAGSFIFNYYITLTENINKKSDFKIKASRLRRIFGSFIFLPLALIYLVIFGAYGIKILITGIRPKGIIIRLGIGYFTLGIISSYLIYPDKTKIQEIINKTLYISFILIALMMIGAITKRINQYGITINRCFVCYIIAFIIIFSALSLIFTKKRFVSFIYTLIILSFISVYGHPINVNNISFKSQVNRLETLLSKENISLPLTEGALKDTDEKPTRLIVGAIDELIENYNKDKIINKIINYEYENSYRSSRSNIREFLGCNANYDYYNSTYKYYNYWQTDTDNIPIDVSGYTKIFSFDGKYINDKILKLNIDDQEYKFDLSNYLEEFKEKSDIYNKNNKEENATKSPALTLEVENYKLIINGFSFQENLNEGKIDFNNIQGYILIK